MFTVNLKDQPDSPYSMSRYMASEIDAKDPLDSMLLTYLATLPVSQTYTVRTLERRPDLISHAVYGTTELYELLMCYNGIVNHEEIVSGMRLNCFSKNDLDNLIASISVQTSR